MAAQVLGTAGPSAETLQRKCAQCEEEAGENNKVRRQETGAGPDLAPSIVHEVLRAPGQPLDPVARNFMEPRFGQDFSGVRIHANAEAADSARAVGALAYTYGNNIVFGPRQYAPESHTGRRLLAHELTHVIQQNRGFGVNRAIQRAGSPSSPTQTPAAAPTQTIAPSCTGHQDEINAAWSRAIEMVDGTISHLETMITAMQMEGGPRRLMPRQTKCVETSFGDVGGLDGSGEGGSTFTFLRAVIQNFRSIQTGFSGGKNLRCDPDAVAKNECDWRAAFVVVRNSKDIFLCATFFDPDNSVDVRAGTLIHEMAHSVLRISHRGIPEKTMPETLFDYRIPLGLEFADAKHNAFAFEILAGCLGGAAPTSEVIGSPTAAAGNERRASISFTGGGTVTPAIQGLAGVAGRLSLRPGALVIFNPYIGVNILYSPTTSAQPAGFFTGLAEAGLRIQQPTRGAYLDLAGGGFVGFEAPLAAPLKTTAGLSAGAGAGWRWDRVELGVETRGLFPLTQGDPNRVVVLGRLGIRFGK